MKKLFTAILLLSAVTTAHADVMNIGNDELKQLKEAGVPIIDVRRPDEWQKTGVVEGSHLMTFFDSRGNYDLQGWLEQLSRVAKPDQPMVLICRTGNRTGIISRFLDKKLSYRKVHNVARGITHWIAEGNKTVVPVN